MIKLKKCFIAILIANVTLDILLFVLAIVFKEVIYLLFFLFMLAPLLMEAVVIALAEEALNEIEDNDKNFALSLYFYRKSIDNNKDEYIVVNNVCIKDKNAEKVTLKISSERGTKHE